MPDLRCQECGGLFFQHRGRPAKRCPDCRETPGVGRRYGEAHQKLRKELAPVSVGEPCSRCGKPMLDPDDMDLDHNDDGIGYRGMSHLKCNRSAAAAKGNRERAAAYRRERGLEPKTTAPKPSTIPEAQPGDKRVVDGMVEIRHEGQWWPLRPAEPTPVPEPKPTVKVEKTATGRVTLSKAETELAEEVEGKVRLRPPYRRVFFSVVENRWIGC